MSTPLVLITGATGHLGFRALVLALEAGYRVVATVRREEQAKKIYSKHSILPYQDQLSFAVVKDITAPGAFKEAMQGVTYVIHIASPIASPAPSGNEGVQAKTMAQRFYDPARKGTLTLLETAIETPSVRRVVITSSVVILEPNEGEYGAGAYDARKSLPTETGETLTDVFEAYSNSKIIAYEAARDFAKDRNPAFDLIHVLPGYIQGANELNEKAEDLQNGSKSTTMGTALGTIIDGPKLTAQVLLDDVAKAHVLALDPKDAANSTNLVVAGNGGRGIPWDEMAAIVERQYPNEVKAGILKPTKGQQDWMTKFDVRESEKTLSYRFAGGDEMVKSVVDQYLQLRGK